MKITDKDCQILQHIVRYCNEVEATVSVLGKNKHEFMKDFIYCNAVSMPIQQIGELAKHLSDDFVNETSQIPWKAIKGMRTIFAHGYLGMNREEIWETAQHDIPKLSFMCQEIMKDNQIEIPEPKAVDPKYNYAGTGDETGR